MKDFFAKKKKLNYIIHNPNTVEDTSKMLLDIFVQANEKKVGRKLQELVDCHAVSDSDKKEVEVQEVG